MKKKITTTEAVKNFRKIEKLKGQLSDARIEHSIVNLIIPMCELGLVDDIEPDGTYSPETFKSRDWVCKNCGKVDYNDVPDFCNQCGQNIWIVKEIERTKENGRRILASYNKTSSRREKGV
jgi:ribosomal protein L37E